MFSWIYKLGVERPWYVLLCLLIAAFVAASGLQKLSFSNDYRAFFDEGDPQLAAFEKMQSLYSKSDNVVILVAPKDGNVFSTANLSAVAEITDAAWQVPYSTRVDSIANYQHSYAVADSLNIEPLVESPSRLTDAELNDIRAIALNEPNLVDKLVSQSGDVAVININISMPEKDPMQEVPEVAAKVYEIQKAFEQRYPDVTLYLSGIVMMNAAFAEVSNADSLKLMPLTVLIILLAVGVFLRTVTGTVLTFLVIVVSVITTIGLVGWSSMALTGPSASAPIMIMSLAVADCVHVLTTMYYHMCYEGDDKRRAIEASIRVNAMPIFITSLTTAIGFLSMNFSESPPYRDLGNIVAVGVLIACILSLTFLPAMLRLLPVRVKSVENRSQPRVWDALAKTLVEKKLVLLTTVLGVSIFFVAFAPSNETNDNFVEYFDETVPIRQANNFMQEKLAGFTIVEVSVESGQPGGVYSPEYLRVVDEFSHWMRHQPLTDHVDSVVDTIKRLNKNMHNDDPAWHTLPDNESLAAQYVLLYEMSLPYGLDLNNQLNIDKSSTRVIVTLNNPSSRELLSIEKSIESWFNATGKDYAISISSPNLIFAHIGQRNIHTMLISAFIALVCISFILTFVLRSLKYGLLSLVPNLLPPAIGFGMWYFIDGRIGIGLSLVVGITLGIVVDDTVHFLSKYIHARRKLGLSAPEAIPVALKMVGPAMVVTTFVLAAGYSVLAMSSFKMNSDMGALTAITVVVALIIDIILLPLLLLITDRKEKPQKITAQVSDIHDSEVKTNA